MYFTYVSNESAGYIKFISGISFKYKKYSDELICVESSAVQPTFQYTFCAEELKVMLKVWLMFCVIVKLVAFSSKPAEFLFKNNEQLSIVESESDTL